MTQAAEDVRRGTEPPDQTEPGDQATQHRSVSPTAQDSLLLSD
jgi:hypothetical protein